jgi:hypothetical protein
MNHRDVKSMMLQPGETVFEAAHRIGAIREQRAAWRAPIDKLAERDRLTRYWKSCYPVWQPELCRIDPSFALVHADSFRPGMLFGRLSLLPGHVAPHIAHQREMNARLAAREATKQAARQAAEPQLALWTE